MVRRGLESAYTVHADKGRKEKKTQQGASSLE